MLAIDTAEPITNRAARALVIVAHPDDETIGAASLLLRRWRCRLIHVTNGAPRDPRFRPAHAGTRQQYARLRRSELTRALALAGVEARCASGLGVPDMEAVEWLDRIALRLAAEIASSQPDVVVTHDYAGGHPDHDAVACAVAIAGRLLERRGQPLPAMYEMPLYHGEGGRFQVGEFPAAQRGAAAIVLTLSETERRRKRAMLDVFASQQQTLRPFYALEVERFRRISPSTHDFTRAPHEGPLLYERWGFPITGERWRSVAAVAVRRLDTSEAHA
ncbi:MAG TPA: PIG-L family deacetylase [Enhygromyxa sp.]|nr:PIG-L family deacetylase [Enhygromyxa sp.]